MKLWIVVSVSLLSAGSALANGRAFGGGAAVERRGAARPDRGSVDRGAADRGAAHAQPITPREKGNFEKPNDCKKGQCGSAGL